MRPPRARLRGRRRRGRRERGALGGGASGAGGGGLASILPLGGLQEGSKRARWKPRPKDP